MILIRIHEPGGGVEIPRGKRLLMVVAEELDGEGNWVPSRTNKDLRTRPLWRVPTGGRLGENKTVNKNGRNNAQHQKTKLCKT